MRKTTLLLVFIFCLSSILNAQEKLTINTSKSSIKWIGEYTFYFGGHDGFINFKNGYLLKKEDKITGGEFVIDMNSIINTDIENEKGKKSLVKHLKQADFFDTKKYPTAKLIITKVEFSNKTNARFEADLTLKGITKSINFRAKFDHQKKEMKTKFKIDRRRWNVNYTSRMRDGAISDAIGFEVSVKL